MKIATKFIGASTILVAAVAVLSGGGTWWRNTNEAAAVAKHYRAYRGTELANKARMAVLSDLDRVKNSVLV